MTPGCTHHGSSTWSRHAPFLHLEKAFHHSLFLKNSCSALLDPSTSSEGISSSPPLFLPWVIFTLTISRRLYCWYICLHWTLTVEAMLTSFLNSSIHQSNHWWSVYYVLSREAWNGVQRLPCSKTSTHTWGDWKEGACLDPCPFDPVSPDGTELRMEGRESS